MTVYRINTQAGVMYASANLAQAAAPIHVYFGINPGYDDPDAEGYRAEDEDYEGLRWEPVPYQTADARHDETAMADILAEHCDMGDVLDVEIVEPK